MYGRAHAKKIDVTLDLEQEPDSAQMSMHHTFQPDGDQLGYTASEYV